MRELRSILGLALCASIALSACGDDRNYRERPKTEKKLIILGIDGMDPTLLRRFIREGRVPNLARLAETSFIDLQTTDPPQSPVAWSAFITGLDLGGHGIYDFVHRDPAELSSYLSTSRPVMEEKFLGLISTGGGGHELLRGGQAFWQKLEEEKVGASMVKIPANFPPAKTDANESMSGMGTPDMLGTYGTFQIYTDDPEWDDRTAKSGVVHNLNFEGRDSTSSLLFGPGYATCFDQCTWEGAENKEVEKSACYRDCLDIVSTPITFEIDREKHMAMIDIGDRKVVLQKGEWSEWTTSDFGIGITGSPSVHGMVRMYLRDTEPFYLYTTPVNADPLDSDLHITEPPTWSQEIAKKIGRFYTQGMAEDTKALSGGVLTDEEFLSQSHLVYEERVKLLRHEMETYEGGLLFFYFSTIDLTSHMYYGSMEPDAPAHYARYKDVVPDTYTKVDKMVGEVLEWAGDTPVIVMSDHGFAPWRYKVNLNTWLAQQNYLVLAKERKPGPLGHINWDETQAYAIGLNQLFLNLKGREAHGVVLPEEREMKLRQLKRDLELWRYAETGERVVTKAMEPAIGSYADRAPDLIVGYNRGFRSSDSSALGAVGSETIEPNTGHWNGDHCMHASHVPGVLLSNRKLAVTEASLVDFAPTVLRYFGITPPEGMAGQQLFEDK